MPAIRTTAGKQTKTLMNLAFPGSMLLFSLSVRGH